MFKLIHSARTARFSRLEAIIQMSQLVAPVIGSLLLSIDVFIPFIVAIPFAMLSLPLSAILPQMKDRPRSRRPCKAADEPPQDPEHGELPADREHQSEEDTLLGSDPDSLSSDERHREANTAYHQTSWREKFRIKLAHLHDDMSEYARLFYTNSIVRFASVAFLVTTFGHQSLHILIQYASKRFDVTIAEVSQYPDVFWQTYVLR